ncbi:hypothetical protein KPL71_007490 [Citrus sinensis]|uniref:Uncharacterized protein n=1 Tax=Citrus sinensis TaxID=2711 RepID=A0ACB8M0B4_CITSI|nr:hypothetical protein KPL71_007490 [Citrus sinensis]
MLLFYFVPALLRCFMASLAMTTVKNITTDQSALLAFKAHIADPYSVLTKNWSVSYSIGELPNLIAIFMKDNYLSGSIPSSFYNISSLKMIRLSSNSLSGSLPNDLCNRLPSLEQLVLRSNGFFGQIPLSLSKCTQLQHLWLEHNKFTGRLPENIGNLSKLRSLVLGHKAHNSLHGMVLVFLRHICVMS